MIDQEFWRDRRVLLTGITGFKGSWLALWLWTMGARVRGLALPPDDSHRLFVDASIGTICPTAYIDIRDASAVRTFVESERPQIILHLAAQPLVRQSYRAPLETLATNVMGTAHVLDAARTLQDLDAILVVATDKCYLERDHLGTGYREGDALGGHDPYSASKAAGEIIVSAYWNSYFRHTSTGLGSARAGNVVGGGDWALDRLIPDLVRAWQQGDTLTLRNPKATRPWQHVLDCLHGYILLAQCLARDGPKFSRGWNFGPDELADASVEQVVKLMSRDIPIPYACPVGEHPREAPHLKLDSTLAGQYLHWHPKLGLSETIEWTASWYKRFQEGADARELMLEHLATFQSPALEVRGR